MILENNQGAITIQVAYGFLQLKLAQSTTVLIKIQQRQQSLPMLQHVHTFGH